MVAFDIGSRTMRESLADEVCPDPADVRATLADAQALASQAPLLTVAGQAPSDRRRWAPPADCRIVACVDVQARDGAPSPVKGQRQWHLVVRRLEGAVRPGDWVCPIGDARLAVCFASSARRIPASAIGRRLAGAMQDHLAVGSSGEQPEIAVGIGFASENLPLTALAGQAIASVRSARHHRSSSVTPGSPVVAVSQLRSAGAARLCRRIVVALSGDPSMPSAEHRRAAEHRRRASDTALAASRDEAIRVLVVDPEPSSRHVSRLATAAVASAARRVGAAPMVSMGSDAQGVLLDCDIVEPHLAVVVLHSWLESGRSTANIDPWEPAARITKVLGDAGLPVIAVSLHASALAVAACVEQGAIGLLEVEALPVEITRLAEGTQRGYRDERWPDRYHRLVQLTPSERRVMHLMMRGLNAAEIAAEHVVSLSTVRTHIRSILRKLDVSSQLAAVALANGQSMGNSFLA